MTVERIGTLPFSPITTAISPQLSHSIRTASESLVTDGGGSSLITMQTVVAENAIIFLMGGATIGVASSAAWNFTCDLRRTVPGGSSFVSNTFALTGSGYTNVQLSWIASVQPGTHDFEIRFTGGRVGTGWSDRAYLVSIHLA